MSKIPFAIVGSNTAVKTKDGRIVRAREYPWGVIEVDNEEHCDFVKLRQMLIRTHMEELKEKTSDVLYENYRSDKLMSMGVEQDQTVFKEVKYTLLIVKLTQSCCETRGGETTPSSETCQDGE